MANPLKVLSALSASYGAAISGSSGLKVQQGGLVVEVGGATITAGGLTVSAGTSAVQALTATTLSGSSTLQAGGAATLGSTLNVASTSTLTGDVTFGSNILKAADGATALTLSSTSGDLAVAGDLKVGGNDIKASDGTTAVTLAGADVSVAGDLTVGGNDIKSSGGTTVFTLDGANVTVAGNLTVRGTTTAIDSTTVNIGDSNINLATGSATLLSLNGAGVDLGSAAQVQWRYDNSTSAWKSNVALNVSGALPVIRLSDFPVVSRIVNDVHFANNSLNGLTTYSRFSARAGGSIEVSGSTTASVDAKDEVRIGTSGAPSVYVGSVNASTASVNAKDLLSVGSTLTAVTAINGVSTTVYGSTVAAVTAPLTIISGSTAIQLSGAVGLDSTLSVAGNASLSSVTASSGVKVQGDLSGSRGDFSSLFINGIAVGTGTATKVEVNNAYNQLRYVESGSLNGSGQKIINLSTTTYGATYFAAASLHSCSLDVMTDTDGSGWTNDLVAVKLFVDAGDLKVQIDAPASPNAGYRLVAINEKLFNIA